jgi:F0F1-type ATP synthase beta subunit
MIQHELDSTIVLSRAVAAQGIRPAVDILASKSSLLTPEVVGERHYKLATRATAILQKYESLKGIIAIIGESELSAEDREDYNKAKELIEFFKQRFNVMEKVTGVPGEHMTRDQTLDGVEQIVGKAEEIDEAKVESNIKTEDARLGAAAAKFAEHAEQVNNAKPTEEKPAEGAEAVTSADVKSEPTKQEK